MKIRLFTVPFEFPHEEKLFWNMSGRQLGYAGAALLVAGVFITRLSVSVKLLVFIPSVIILAMCAFLKIGNMYFDRFMIVFLKYCFRKKKYIYGR
ncbi:PrgI family protein [Caldanaerobius fijiensis]|uniref:PrgI family protein n=1 Tax=Caldanaerobius fijiensis TaxID=456330 RepID=UPI000933B302|nr:PrgI family protein [Caldanaerobius fijiensis]